MGGKKKGKERRRQVSWWTDRYTDENDVMDGWMDQKIFRWIEVWVDD
jgi:hypothetical protein